MATDNKNKVLNVPHLRFPEFCGEWRKYKLAEICSFFSGGTPSSSKKEYYDGNIPFIRSGELHMDKTELFITEVGLNNSAAKIVDVGDLLLALYGATSGDIAISQIKGAINQAILCIRTTQNKKFIESVWKKHVEKLLQTYLQGGQGNLSADIVKNISFYFAESNEQIKLAKFITLLDERIAIQNKIIEKYESLIKGIIYHTKTVGLTNNTWKRIELRKVLQERNEVSIRPTTGIKPLYTTIATVTMNLIVSAAIVLLNPYVTVYISYKIPPFALSVHIPDVSTSIYVEVDSKVLLGLLFCDKAFVR